jgi:hypothetical protein
MPVNQKAHPPPTNTITGYFWNKMYACFKIRM